MYVTGLGSYYISEHVNMCHYTCMSRASAVIVYICTCAVVLLYMYVTGLGNYYAYICTCAHVLLYTSRASSVIIYLFICTCALVLWYMFVTGLGSYYVYICACEHVPWYIFLSRASAVIIMYLSIHVQSGGNCDEVYSDTEGTQALCVCARLP